MCKVWGNMSSKLTSAICHLFPDKMSRASFANCVGLQDIYIKVCALSGSLAIFLLISGPNPVRGGSNNRHENLGIVCGVGRRCTVSGRLFLYRL